MIRIRKEYEPDGEYIRRVLFAFSETVKMDIHFIRNPVTQEHQYLHLTVIGMVQDEVEEWDSIVRYFRLESKDVIEKARTMIIRERSNIELIKI